MSVVTGHPDWLPAIVVVDQPSILAVEFNRGVPFTSGVLDVRRWAAFQWSIRYEAANAGPPASTGVISLEWGDTSSFGNILTKHEYEINSFNSTDCGPSQISDGHYGPFLRYNFAAGNGAGSTFTGALFGSNRPFTKTRAMEMGGVGSRGISNDRFLVLFNAVVGAGATIERNVRLGVGPATIHINTFTAGGPIDVSLYTPQYGVAGGRIFTALGLVPPQSQTFQITMPRRVSTLRITNNSGATATTVLVSVTIDDN